MSSSGKRTGRIRERVDAAFLSVQDDQSKGGNLLILSVSRHYLTLNTDISSFFLYRTLCSLSPVFIRAEVDLCRFAALPPISLSVHSSSHFAETGDVAASDQAGEFSFGGLHIFLCGLQSVLEA